MCGIVGYTGPNPALSRVIEGLRRLEYRGYDSAGVALVSEKSGPLIVAKKAGKLSNLENSLTNAFEKSTSGIGHTRWATHGGPTDTNAHPHISNDGKLAVIHNGIIENYVELKSDLEKRGHKFTSETDTESVAHLLSDEFGKSKNLAAAMRTVCKQLRGSFTLLAIHSDTPEVIVGARRNSPLVVGVGDNENFLASDVSAFISHTKKALELGQDQVVEVTPTSVSVSDLNGESITPKAYEITWDAKAAERGGFTHFMLKEIFEQPDTIFDCLRGRLLHEEQQIVMAGVDNHIEALTKASRIMIVACGTSWHAGLVAEYMIEELCRIPVEVEYASEFRYRNPVIHPGDVIIAISQSGETADTLVALESAKEKGAFIFGVVNAVGSSIARLSHAGAYTHAGPEIGVASTKAFTGQLAVLSMMALKMAKAKGSISNERYVHLVNELASVPEKVKEILADTTVIERIAKQYKGASDFLYLGRGYNFPIALEGALKLKEITYIHAEGYPAAEMKHGPIALVDENLPVVFVATKDMYYEKVVSNMQEIKARKGQVIAVATIGDDVLPTMSDNIMFVPDIDEVIAPLLSVIPLQLLSYYVGIYKDIDVDKPRNLAKSVTVE